ncbi:MAG: SH3 domain-containing protein [Lachnospiraceae bacterium]|nr:SH3 domain-containing protein [Lachnospiraceae bacterium]
MANKNRIQDALGEAREHLILNKYNEAMMLMAQITMDVIEHLTDEALIVSKGYEEDLKTLRASGIIAEDTAHNFETLIISGVQAHNGVDIPKEHAEQALQVLTNEIDLILGNEDINPSLSENLEEKSKFNANTDKPLYEYDEDDEPYPGDFSKDMTLEGETPAFMQKAGDEVDFRKKEKMREQMLANERKKSGRKKVKLITLIIPIVLILLVAFVVKGMFFSGSDTNRIEETTVPTVATTEPETTETEPTEPPLPREAGYYDVTGDLVKIRDSATTEGSKVLGTVSRGGKVQVKSFYNADWAIIVFEGRDAYISRRYIVKDETLSPVFEE